MSDARQDGIVARLHDAVCRLLGPPGDISELRRLTAGATKATWFFKAQVSSTNLPLILQTTNGSSRQGDDATLPLVAGENDAALMMAASRAGVPAPTVRAVLTEDCGVGEGYIMDYVPGETIARRILREPRFAPLRQSFAAQCGEILARIHKIEANCVPFLTELSAQSQIAVYRNIYHRYDHPVPALEVAFRWAEEHMPLAGLHDAVVHGDFRMGNLICDEERIQAVLDWELACLGDPMQDLGWLCVKTWRFGGQNPVGGIGQRADLFAAYERAGGIAVDPARVRFWEAWGCIKWAIICLMKGQSQRSVEAFAIGRRMEEPLYDFLEFIG
ncbi:MAG TPA: phosphotransferase family protein [Candidatus Angelobacter sp.]|jgi:aminoglycoside phosphotransferase (APT) family kinase protein|nr:phosphotransferase family protein [Candidatus Angelobacter sp.]